MAQLVEHQTLDFGSDHDPRVVRSSSALSSLLSMEHAWDSPSRSLSLSLSPLLTCACACSLALSQIKKKKILAYLADLVSYHFSPKPHSLLSFHALKQNISGPLPPFLEPFPLSRTLPLALYMPTPFYHSSVNSNVTSLERTNKQKHPSPSSLLNHPVLFSLCSEPQTEGMLTIPLFIIRLLRGMEAL